VIPASTYRDTPEAATIGVPNYLVVSAAMADDTAYAVTRLLFEAKPTLVVAHLEARRLDRRAAIFTFPVPLHLGAARYYRETKP
jgi:TRAP-type uncharacterized transport system substrate-binding protein